MRGKQKSKRQSKNAMAKRGLAAGARAGQKQLERLTTWRQTGRDETGLNEDKRLARRGGGATQDCFTGEREERLCQAVSCRYIAAWRTAFKEYDGQSKGNKAS